MGEHHVRPTEVEFGVANFREEDLLADQRKKNKGRCWCREECGCGFISIHDQIDRIVLARKTSTPHVETVAGSRCGR